MNDRPNQSQREYWSGEAGQKWVEMQTILDKQIEALGKAMLASAGLSEGEQVLDIGCGCGWTTLRIARALGKNGRVTGVDLSTPMLARAEQRTREAGLDNVEFIRADVQTHDFARARFDLCTSRFGVMFFDDPVAAFTNVRSALNPDGRLAFVCWRPLKENPFNLLPLQAAARYIEIPPPPDPEAPGPFSLADPDRVNRILDSAGFTSIAVEAYDCVIPELEGGLDRAVELRFEIGPLSRIIQDATEDQREKVRAAVKEALAPYFSEDGPVMTSATWLVTAQAS